MIRDGIKKTITYLVILCAASFALTGCEQVKEYADTAADLFGKKDDGSVSGITIEKSDGSGEDLPVIIMETEDEPITPHNDEEILADFSDASKPAGSPDLKVVGSVAVVDAKKCKPYLRNFGEFFENQIEHAGTIILSRTGQMSDEKINACVELIREHNPKATIITTPWDKLDGKKILDTIEDAKDLEAELMKEVMEKHEHDHEHEHHHDHDHDHDHHHHHDHEDDHDHEHEHDHHEHGEECSCGCHDHDHHHHHHDHDADEVFTSIGIETSTKYTKEKVEECLEELDDTGKYGTILRCKGMLPTEGERFIHFDYVPGECEVRDGAAEVIGKICVIGSELKEDAIRTLFN